jgi:hypothetical protein
MKTVITCILEVETEPDGESDELYDMKHREMERRLAVAQEELELLVVKLVKRRIPESNFGFIFND